jgi:hypothetical protein
VLEFTLEASTLISSFTGLLVRFIPSLVSFRAVLIPSISGLRWLVFTSILAIWLPFELVGSSDCFVAKSLWRLKNMRSVLWGCSKCCFNRFGGLAGLLLGVRYVADEDVAPKDSDTTSPSLAMPRS